MKAYKVVLTESAEKELQKLPAKAIAKLMRIKGSGSAWVASVSTAHLHLNP